MKTVLIIIGVVALIAVLTIGLAEGVYRLYPIAKKVHDFIGNFFSKKTNA